MLNEVSERRSSQGATLRSSEGPVKAQASRIVRVSSDTLTFDLPRPNLRLELAAPSFKGTRKFVIIQASRRSSSAVR